MNGSTNCSQRLKRSFGCSCRYRRGIRNPPQAWFSRRLQWSPALSWPSTPAPPDCQWLSTGQGPFSGGPSTHSALAVPVARHGAHAQHPELFALRASLTHLPDHLDNFSQAAPVALSLKSKQTPSSRFHFIRNTLWHPPTPTPMTTPTWTWLMAFNLSLLKTWLNTFRVKRCRNGNDGFLS